MKCKIIIPTILVVLVAAYVGYIANLPVPEGLPEPWKMRAYIMMCHILILSFGHDSSLTKRILKGVPSDHISSRMITDTEFDGIPVRIYAPPSWKQQDQSHPLPALVFIHGGGFISGSIDAYDFAVNDIATKLDRVLVVSIEYRLAPLHPFPAAIDDCTKATAWLLSHAEEYNVDPNRIGISGDSAGGNLAAAVSQRLTFNSQYSHLPKFRLQALIYPALQAVDFELPSYQQNGHYQVFVLTKKVTVMCVGLYMNGNKEINFIATAFSNNHTSPYAKKLLAEQGLLSHYYIPEKLRSDEYVPPTSIDFGNEILYESIKDTLLNPDFAPLMRLDLRGLPEAYIITCQFDVLRDDGIIYAKRLEKAGVKVMWKHYKNGIHGSMTEQHDGWFQLETGRQMRRDLVAYLNQTLLS